MNPPEARRQCPTRADGADPLIVHWILRPRCQERQRSNYHKCYTCAHKNGVSAGAPGRNVLPPLGREVARELARASDARPPVAVPLPTPERSVRRAKERAPARRVSVS
jgi:hypothetical protein